MKSLNVVFLTITVCCTLLFTSIANDSAILPPLPPEVETGPLLVAATVPLTRHFRSDPYLEVAEDNHGKYESQLRKIGYSYVGTYGFLFNNIQSLKNWMRLNPPRKSRFQQVRPPIVKPQPPVISKDPPKPDWSRPSSSKPTSIVVNIGPEHYELLASYFSFSRGEYRATIVSQAPTDGYIMKKTLGYLITPEGYDLLSLLNPSGRLRAELAPVYQFHHPTTKDWLLAVNGGDFQHAYAEGYEKKGMIGYLPKVSGQPISCEDDVSACIGDGEYEIFRSQRTGNCYCKHFSPK